MAQNDDNPRVVFAMFNGAPLFFARKRCRFMTLLYMSLCNSKICKIHVCHCSFPEDPCMVYLSTFS